MFLYHYPDDIVLTDVPQEIEAPESRWAPRLSQRVLHPCLRISFRLTSTMTGALCGLILMRTMTTVTTNQTFFSLAGPAILLLSCTLGYFAGRTVEGMGTPNEQMIDVERGEHAAMMRG